MMADSTHRVDVIPVTLKPHPNADSLSLVDVFEGGYQVIVRTEDWIGKTQGAFIQPDSIVPDKSEYAFLKGKRRIKAAKLRGEWSVGLLVQAPEGSQIGDDVAEQLGITHYEPPIIQTRITRGTSCRPPIIPGIGEPPTYDVESFRKYAKKVFLPGEVVWVTEKIHGTNARFVFDGEKLHAGSHREWKRPDEKTLWWKITQQYPALVEYCKNNPGNVVYGEIYGWVQKGFRYGMGKDEYRLAVFDILEKGKWINAQKMSSTCEKFDVPMVPHLGVFEFDFEHVLQMAEGQSLIADHLREGVVVKPLKERWDSKCRRVCLKIVGNGYLEKSFNV
jgi:RNA ligase (TIGR02306 family)